MEPFVWWPESLSIGGAAVPLAGVGAEVTIRHGRTDPDEEPVASSCQVVLYGVTKAFVEAFEIGEALVLTVSDGFAAKPRFTGRITDARLEADKLTAIAIGRLATLNRYPIGDVVSWPAEKWSDRVRRIFTEAGISLGQIVVQPDPLFDPILAARDHTTAGPTTVGDYLTFLLPMVGGLAADLPDGKILVQAIGARTLNGAVHLAPADVLYSPPWVQVLPAGNIVTVRYQGDQGASVTVADNGSIARYGERPQTIDTSFANVADANYRANLRLSRAAYTHWNILEAPIIRGLDLQLGAAIVLENMPEASPFDPWTPILEGWTDTISGDDWTMTLALSDPLLSGLTLPWLAVPATAEYRWNTVDPATDWTEALTLEKLNAS